MPAAGTPSDLQLPSKLRSAVKSFRLAGQFLSVAIQYTKCKYNAG